MTSALGIIAGPLLGAAGIPQVVAIPLAVVLASIHRSALTDRRR